MAGWIWPISHSLPTPVLKQTTWNTVQKLQIGDFHQWASKQSVLPTKQRCSTQTAATPWEPANHSASLSRLYWLLSLLPLYKLLNPEEKETATWEGLGSGEENQSAEIAREREKKNKNNPVHFSSPQFSRAELGPIWGEGAGFKLKSFSSRFNSAKVLSRSVVSGSLQPHEP